MSFELIEKMGGALVSWFRMRQDKAQEEKLDKQHKEEFFKELAQAQHDLDTARRNYNFAKEPALLEYYIYEIKAAETRLNYYLKLAKREQLSNEMFLSGLFVGADGRREELS